jgi:deoxycytidylate deaminase
MSIESYLKIARKNALRSTEDYRMGACLVKSGRVLGVGVNQKNKTNRLIREFFNNFPTMHAEACCMSNLDPEDIKGSVLYVYRQRKIGNPGMAKPCIRCARLIISVGIKRVVYSVDYFPYYEIWDVKKISIEELDPTPRKFEDYPPYTGKSYGVLHPSY